MQNASPTMYCAVYTRFAYPEQTRKPLKRGEGLQIASEAGRFTAATLLKCKRARGIPVRAQDAPLYRVSPDQTRKVTVKTRRYKQDAKGADFAQGVYIEVHDQAKTQARQCIAQYIRVSSDQNSNKIVTGPSLIWLIFISAPKIPHLTGTPCSASFSAA